LVELLAIVEDADGVLAGGDQVPVELLNEPIVGVATYALGVATAHPINKRSRRPVVDRVGQVASFADPTVNVAHAAQIRSIERAVEASAGQGRPAKKK